MTQYHHGERVEVVAEGDERLQRDEDGVGEILHVVEALEQTGCLQLWIGR